MPICDDKHCNLVYKIHLMNEIKNGCMCETSLICWILRTSDLVNRKKTHFFSLITFITFSGLKAAKFKNEITFISK